MAPHREATQRPPPRREQPGAPHRVIPDAPPRRNTREAHPGARRHGPSSEMPDDGNHGKALRGLAPRSLARRPPGAGIQALSPGRQPGRDPSGSPPMAPHREAHRGASSSEEAPPGPSRETPPSPPPRRKQHRSPSPGVTPSLPPRRERSGSPPRDADQAAPPRRGHHGQHPTEAPPRQAPRSPLRERLQGATPPRSPKRLPPGGSSEPLSGSRFRSSCPATSSEAVRSLNLLGEQLLERLLGATPRGTLPSRPVRTAHRQGCLGRTRTVVFYVQ